jgi:hypothetical protein
MYANAAPNVKIAEKAKTLSNAVGEKGGEPSRKFRIISDAMVKGLISAKVTNTPGNLPVLPKSCIKESG